MSIYFNENAQQITEREFDLFKAKTDRQGTALDRLVQGYVNGDGNVTFFSLNRGLEKRWELPCLVKEVVAVNLYVTVRLIAWNFFGDFTRRDVNTTLSKLDICFYDFVGKEKFNYEMWNLLMKHVTVVNGQATIDRRKLYYHFKSDHQRIRFGFEEFLESLPPSPFPVEVIYERFLYGYSEKGA